MLLQFLIVCFSLLCSVVLSFPHSFWPPSENKNKNTKNTFFFFPCSLLWYFCLKFGVFLKYEWKKPMTYTGNWLFSREDIRPIQPNSTSLWFSQFAHLNGTIKVNPGHLSSFKLTVVHLVKVIPDSRWVFQVEFLKKWSENTCMTN